MDPGEEKSPNAPERPSGRRKVGDVTESCDDDFEFVFFTEVDEEPEFEFETEVDKEPEFEIKVDKKPGMEFDTDMPAGRGDTLTQQ